MAVDYEAEVAALVERLRERDTDPAYVGADVVDSYARISRLAKARDEDKTVRQTLFNLREIESRRARLGEVLVDDDKSAWKKDGVRLGWLSLVDRVRKRESQGVAVRFLARLVRQSQDMLTLLDTADATYGRSGFLVIGDRREYRTGNAGDGKILRDKASDAQFESDEKSERIRDRNADRLAEGDDRNGPSPFGHRWESERASISDERLEAERLAVHDGYVAIVEQARSWGYVARMWNARGLTTRRGFRWDGQRVADCLKLPRHAGFTRKGAKVHGRQGDPSTAIVDAAMYERLMVLLDGRRRGRQPAEPVVVEGVETESPHFVSSILRCGGCGYGMVGGTEPRRRYEDGSPTRIYKCPPKGCNACGVDARWAETWAGAVVVRVLSRPEHASMLARRDDALRRLAERIGEYEAAISQLRDEAEAIHPSRVEALAETRAAIRRREAELSPMLDERERLQLASRVEATPADVDELIAAWNAAGPSERRRMVRLALPAGFHCAPVGRGARIRGRAILTRFSVERGGATPTREAPAA
jgi:site-specific DNA recombinase